MNKIVGGEVRWLLPACRQPLSRWTNSLSEGAFWFVLFYCSPSVTACAVPASPQAVEPFGLCNSAQKPALKGEVAMSNSELTEGLHRCCSFFRQPLSRLAATAPRPGSLLVCASRRPKSCPREIFPLSHGLRRASSPASGGAFWLVQPPPQKLSPRAGKVAVSVSERSKGVRFGAAKCRFSPPYKLLH